MSIQTCKDGIKMGRGGEGLTYEEIYKRIRDEDKSSAAMATTLQIRVSLGLWVGF